MSRLEIANLLLIVVVIGAGAIIGFLLILHRERRRRAHWSTRSRAAAPHWSIMLAARIERLADRIVSRRHRHRLRRKRDL